MTNQESYTTPAPSRPATAANTDDLFSAFPEPCGWSMAWEGTALGQFTTQNHPVTVANDVRPTDKPNRT